MSTATRQSSRNNSTECELELLHTQAKNALSDALELLADTSDPSRFRRALGRALRAAAALKQACAEVKNSEVAA